MSCRLAVKTITPRTGWKYFQPETQLWIEADHYDDLLRKVREHRVYKGLSTDNMVEEIEAQICMRTGHKTCRDCPPHFPDKTDLADQDTIINFNKTALNFFTSGMATVPREEAERRAAICRGCPFNVGLRQCSCSVFYRLLSAAVPASAVIPGISICTVCGCALKAKVWLPGETIDNGDTRFPDWCWQADLTAPAGA